MFRKYIYIYMHVATTHEKEAMNLEESEKRYVEGRK